MVVVVAVVKIVSLLKTRKSTHNPKKCPLDPAYSFTVSPPMNEIFGIILSLFSPDALLCVYDLLSFVVGMAERSISCVAQNLETYQRAHIIRL